MTKKTCSLTGLNETACMHCLHHREVKTDSRITRVLWFSIGFCVAIGTLLLEIYIIN